MCEYRSRWNLGFDQTPIRLFRCQRRKPVEHRLRTGDLILFGSGQPLTFDAERIRQRVQRPPIRQVLEKSALMNPEALLRYFGLSREEALAAAGDAPPNSDTRIISEVRLAGLTADPTGQEDPNALLERYFSFDLLPYLKASEAKALLYGSGHYFFAANSKHRMGRVVERLKELDPPTAERLAREHSAWRARREKLFSKKK